MLHVAAHTVTGLALCAFCGTPLKSPLHAVRLQAKFYAPSDALRAFVAQKAGESPLTELPDNGME